MHHPIILILLAAASVSLAGCHPVSAPSEMVGDYVLALPESSTRLTLDESNRFSETYTPIHDKEVVCHGVWRWSVEDRSITLIHGFLPPIWKDNPTPQTCEGTVGGTAMRDGRGVYIEIDPDSGDHNFRKTGPPSSF